MWEAIKARQTAGLGKWLSLMYQYLSETFCADQRLDCSLLHSLPQLFLPFRHIFFWSLQFWPHLIHRDLFCSLSLSIIYPHCLLSLIVVVVLKWLMFLCSVYMFPWDSFYLCRVTIMVGNPELILIRCFHLSKNTQSKWFS